MYYVKNILHRKKHMRNHLIILSFAFLSNIIIIAGNCAENEYFHREGSWTTVGECKICPIDSTSPVGSEGFWNCKCDDPTKDVIDQTCSNCGFDARSMILNRLPICPCAENHFLHPNIVNIRHRGYSTRVLSRFNQWFPISSDIAVDGVESQ